MLWESGTPPHLLNLELLDNIDLAVIDIFEQLFFYKV